jgi:hypothetical protein
MSDDHNLDPVVAVWDFVSNVRHLRRYFLPSESSRNALTFGKMFIDIARFASIYAFMLLGFTHAFYFAVAGSADEDMASFRTPLQTLFGPLVLSYVFRLSVYRMLINDFDLSSLYDNSEKDLSLVRKICPDCAVAALYVIYVFFGTIALMVVYAACPLTI